MRRADRLFQIIQLLRRRKVTTAAALAERLEVSERTIYRDIRDLVASGTPIDGEAGVGYTLRPGYDLPPLMFDPTEIEALVLGARIVESFGDAELGRAARSALSKVETVLPRHLAASMRQSRLYSTNLGRHTGVSRTLPSIRTAVAESRKLGLRYTRADGKKSRRVVRPLGTFYWGSSWTLTAWCELRKDFRNFRLDRIKRVDVLDEQFADEPGCSLRDYLARMGPEAVRLLDS
jgi:predicted DNA-binding transcriptional regulator YafY